MVILLFSPVFAFLKCKANCLPKLGPLVMMSNLHLDLIMSHLFTGEFLLIDIAWLFLVCRHNFSISCTSQVVCNMF